MWLEKKIFSLLGWKAEIKIDLPDKCVACIAPHTSNWDFFYCVMFKEAYRIQVNFLIKEEWTKSIVGGIIHRLGGIGVRRDKSQSSTDIYAKVFDNHKVMRIAITPEGTRSANKDWKLGFYYIALKANVPIALVSLDYKTKTLTIDRLIVPNGDVDTQMAEIKAHYKGVTARYPDRFLI